MSQFPIENVTFAHESRPSVTEKVATRMGAFLDSFSVGSVFVIHFLLVACLLLLEGGPIYESTKPYIAFCNGFLFLSLFWVFISGSIKALHLAGIINLSLLLCDLLVASEIHHTENWLIAINFLNCLLRPMTSLVLIRKAYAIKRQASAEASLQSAAAASAEPDPDIVLHDFANQRPKTPGQVDPPRITVTNSSTENGCSQLPSTPTKHS